MTDMDKEMPFKKNNYTLSIAHIVLSLEIGGLEKVVYTMAIEQKRIGHKVIIICLDSIGILGEQLKKNNIEILCLNRKQSRLDLKAIYKLSSILKRNKINIVHTHNIEAYIYGILPSIFSPKIKSIHTQHGIPDKFNSVKIIYI